MAKRGLTGFLSVFEDIGRQFYDLETDLLVMLDEQGLIEDVNPAFEAELGRTKIEVLGTPLMRLIHIGDLAEFIREFYEPRSRLFRMLKKDSGEIVVRLIACRFRKGQGYIILRRTM